MRLLVDAQLPPALARWLAQQGLQAEHVYEAGLVDGSDQAIWDFAVANAAAIITKDEDFVIRIQSESRGPSIVWIRLGNSSNQALIAWIEPLLASILTALDRGEKLIEVV